MIRASITLKIKAEELDEKFLQLLRTLFNNKSIHITIQPVRETETGSFAHTLEQRTNEGGHYRMGYEAFEEVLNLVEDPGDVDLFKEMVERASKVN